MSIHDCSPRSPLPHCLAFPLVTALHALARSSMFTVQLTNQFFQYCMVQSLWSFSWLFFALPLRASFEPFSPCTSPQLPFAIVFVGHLMSFYGCWVTFEWVDGHPGQWRGFRPLPFSNFVVPNVFCLTLFLWTAILEILRMEETWHSLYPSASKARIEPFFFLLNAFLLAWSIVDQFFFIPIIF